MFVKVDKTNQVVQYPYTLDMFRAENRNVSLPPNLGNSLLARYYIFPVITAAEPEYEKSTQYITEDTTPVFVDGNWIVSWSVSEKSEDRIAIDTRVRSIAIRKERDALMAETDWVSIRAIDTGSNVSTDWMEYRQALRDITSQSGFPWDVAWPVKPN